MKGWREGGGEFMIKRLRTTKERKKMCSLCHEIAKSMSFVMQERKISNHFSRSAKISKAQMSAKRSKKIST